jgi:ABC-type sugar transport system ATPase subunit
MGRALVRQPAVFLLDEPLSNLDARLRTQVRGEIRQLQQRTRTTMLYVTHDQAEAMTLGDRVVVLDRGVVQQIGTPGELYSEPANVFVASFVGTPPMNLMPARLHDGGDVLAVEVAGATLRELEAGSPASELRRFAGSQLTAGFHAEDVELVDAAGRETIAGRVRQVEFLGHESLVGVDADAEAGVHVFIARVEGASALRAGDRIGARVPAGALRIFGPDGKALAVC